MPQRRPPALWGPTLLVLLIVLAAMLLLWWLVPVPPPVYVQDVREPVILPGSAPRPMSELLPRKAPP